MVSKLAMCFMFYLFEREHRARYSGEVILRKLRDGKPMAKNPKDDTRGEFVRIKHH